MTELWNSVDYLRYAEEQFQLLLRQRNQDQGHYLATRIELAIDIARLKKEMHWDGMR
jgi:hypothetical protein